LKTLIVGLGNQGSKRKAHLKNDFCGAVDPLNNKAEYKNLKDVNLTKYNAVLLCVPDNQKEKLINYCIENKKHILVEKPLNLSKTSLKRIEKISNKNKSVVYTAYNHRFEPHFLNVNKIIKKNSLGKMYHCRMFYGNGTSQLVKNSKWKDSGMGVISDLGSHLLDTVHYFFNIMPNNFKLITKKNFENKFPDHAMLINQNKSNLIQLEVSLCMWRNSFKCDIIYERGSIHIDSLCKWGPSKLTIRTRKFPSGIPKEINKIIISEDPTWVKEYIFFKKLIANKVKNNLSKDIWISQILNQIVK
jgi:scyllo-inositol 2-dehydrogenase (NADP+)